MGQVGLDWQLGGLAADPPSGAMGDASDVGELVQALAGFAAGGGAAEGLDAATSSADTAQQPFLTMPQHG